MQDVCAMVCVQGMYAGCECKCACTSVCVCSMRVQGGVCKSVCKYVCAGCMCKVCVQTGVRLSLSLVCSLDLTFRKA